MSHTFSSAELEQISHAVRLLLSPLDHATVDAWRSAVSRRLAPLLHADSAGFLLPIADEVPFFSEEHDPATLARYPDYPPPPLIDGTAVWERIVLAGVSTMGSLYGQDVDRYVNSAYNQEYAGANGAHDPLVAAHSLGGTDARGMAALHFWHERPTGRRFGEREVAILRLLFPAFQSGVELVARLGGHRNGLLHALDALGQGVLVFDPTGRALHETPALTALMATDPEADALRAEIHAQIRFLSVGAAKYARGGAPALQPGLTEVRTAYARYELRISLYGREPRGFSPLILASLERCTPVPRPEAEMRERFGLTRAEVRVARLIAEGRANAEIADTLFISPRTARHHTEHILRKLNIRSRAGVAAKVLC